MKYELLSNFANTWGLVFLVILFVVLTSYAFWPKNKDKFDSASRIPLDEE